MEVDLTKHIKETIKQKLIEFDSYTDNELPEYIMIMVANKKSKESMEGDLSLFLGKNTAKFTSWLLDMLSRMEGNASNLSNGAAVEEDVNGFSVEKVPLGMNAEDDLLLGDDDVLDDELLNVESADEAAALNKLLGKKSEVARDEKPVVKAKPKKDKVSLNRSSKVTAMPTESNKIEQYDPLNPSVKSVANVVTVERKSSVPVALQANKLLLLKAVEDANKSIVGKQNINEIYRPTPIKVLSSSPEKDSQDALKPNFVKMKHFTNTDFEPRKRFASQSSENKPIYHKMRPNLLQVVPQPEERYTPEPLQRSVQITTFDEDVVMEGDSSEEEVATPSILRSPVPTSFVVTLGGIAHTLKRKFTMDSEEGSDSENMFVSENSVIDTEEEAPEVAPVNEKPQEKCRFWPTCKNGDTCIYFHPSVPCKAFPNCTFKDKCLFVHPSCKFDALCNRKDCPYVHSKVFGVSKAFKNTLNKYPDLQKSVICKFYPNCSSYNCSYFHPKKCRFGNQCRSPKCPFSHPSYPSRHQLTWKPPA